MRGMLVCGKFPHLCPRPCHVCWASCPHIMKTERIPHDLYYCSKAKVTNNISTLFMVFNVTNPIVSLTLIKLMLMVEYRTSDAKYEVEQSPNIFAIM